MERHVQCEIVLRKDLDTLADSCAYAFSKQYKHYIDYAPGITPDSDEGGSECRVDGDGAGIYLGALRDAQILPSTQWARPRLPDYNGATIGGIVANLDDFREPEYDDCDKCEFCEGTKIKFAKQLDITKAALKDRLWGLCLDCFKTGGVNAGECRYEHVKAQILAQPAGLRINGL